MRTNYVLIDFENLQPKSLDHLAKDHFKIILFLGARQKEPSFAKAISLRLKTIRISRSGKNAADFHIAYYIGEFAAEDRSAVFHIVSGDNGYDPLLDHLKTKQIVAKRVKAISDISPAKSSNKPLFAERFEAIIARLSKGTKPRTVQTLRRTIGAVFHKRLSEKEVSKLYDELVNKKIVDVSSPKVTYVLPPVC